MERRGFSAFDSIIDDVERAITEAEEAARADEREQCAKIADEASKNAHFNAYWAAAGVAEKIRVRGAK